MRTEIRAQKIFVKNAIDLTVIQRMSGGKIAVAKPLTLETIDPEFVMPEPTMTLRMNEAQLLMDELWDCGLRPSEGSGSAGSLRATEKHLKDMQAIAKGLLKKDGVEV